MHSIIRISRMLPRLSKSIVFPIEWTILRSNRLRLFSMSPTIQGVMGTIASAIVFVPRVTFVISRCQSTRFGRMFVWPESMTIPLICASLESRVQQSTRMISCSRVAKLVRFWNFGVEGGSTPGDLESEGSTVTRGVTWDSITESPISSDMVGEVALDIVPSVETLWPECRSRHNWFRHDWNCEEMEMLRERVRGLRES